MPYKTDRLAEMVRRSKRQADKDMGTAAVRGEVRHSAVDEMLTELYERVAELEKEVFKKVKGSSKPPKDKDGLPADQTVQQSKRPRR